MDSQVKAQPAISVRPLRVDDLPRVQEIDRRSSGNFRAATYQDPFSSCLGGDLGISYVAEIDGEVAGFIFGSLVDRLWLYREGALLEMVGVDPAHRRHGVGQHLLAAFLQGCREKGVREVHVLVASGDSEFTAFLGQSSFQPAEFLDYVCQTGA